MKHKILIVEDNMSLASIQKDWLKHSGYEVETTISEPRAKALIRKYDFDMILSDVRLPEGNGISLLEWVRKEKRNIPFVLTTEYSSVPDVVRTIKLGAIDYLPKPVFREHLLELIEGVLCPPVTRRTHKKELFRRISAKALEVERLSGLVASSGMSVLILVANDTRKESVARSIHENSDRSDMPFVAVNCSVLPRELAASMLFGHEKGAFTGADSAKEGYFCMAKGGTLFLDEIGTMPYELQSLLLRVLEEKVYMPIGSNREKSADVRIVAATNENMEKAIAEGRFREDLYHRLNEFYIHQPSLSECPEDIIPLAEFFRKRFSKELKRETEGFSSLGKSRLCSYSWPGNIRELLNVIKRAVLLAECKSLDMAELVQLSHPIKITENVSPTILPLKDETTEKESIRNALKASNGHRQNAARLLNIDQSTLYRKMRKYGLNK